MHGPPALRGTVQGDRCHTFINTLADSKVDAGAALLDLEWLHALRATRGPFKSHGHRRTLQDCGEELFAAVDENEELFEILHPEIAKELELGATPIFGTDEHRRQVLLGRHTRGMTYRHLAACTIQARLPSRGICFISVRP